MLIRKVDLRGKLSLFTIASYDPIKESIEKKNRYCSLLRQAQGLIYRVICYKNKHFESEGPNLGI
jgi:hypothetical protein